MKIRSAIAATFVASFVWAASAAAQGIIPDVIASTIANGSRGSVGPAATCLSGEAPSARSFERARVRSEATMQAYLSLAGASDAADVSSVFVRNEAKRTWMSAGTPASVNAVDDPLARALASGAALLVEPLFVGAGNGRSAQAIWTLTSADGQTRLGHYRVDFRRESGAFRISKLEMVEGPPEPAPITQYCEDPGDVEAFVAEQQRIEAERAANAPPKPGQPAEGGGADGASAGSDPATRD